MVIVKRRFSSIYKKNGDETADNMLVDSVTAGREAREQVLNRTNHHLHNL